MRSVRLLARTPMRTTFCVLVFLLLPATGASSQDLAPPREVTAVVWSDSAVFRLIAPAGAHEPGGSEPMGWEGFEWLIGWLLPGHETVAGFTTGVTFWLSERTALTKTGDHESHTVSIEPQGSIEVMAVMPGPPLSTRWRGDTLWIRMGWSSALNELLARQPDSVTIGPMRSGGRLTRWSTRVLYAHH
jgi:hypothetical protein